MDRWGYAVPDLYRRITRAYARLRLAANGNAEASAKTPPAWAKALVKGEYYRGESGPGVFLFDGKQLVYQAAMPLRAAVILVPDKLFKQIQLGLKE